MSEKYFRERKFWLFLPAVIVPFLFIFFWLMSGGGVGATEGIKRKGLNTQLPNARGVKDSAKDKMAYYVSADADSSRRLEQIRRDPYRKDSVPVTTKVQTIYRSVVTNHTESDEISKRIEAIQKRMAVTNKPEAVNTENRSNTGIVKNTHPIVTTDPEMEAINGTLDKILAIQHPERIKENTNEKKRAVYSISADPLLTDDSFFGRVDSNKNKKVFHEDAKPAGETEANSISAEVGGEQILHSGSLLKIRLRANMYVGGLTIPAGAYVFGICSLDQERLSVHISSIGYGGNILPVSLSVYELTGMPGIYIPGNIAGEIVKQSMDQGMQSIGLLNLAPSLGSQLTAAGIGAAKNLLAKKVKQVTVTVKAGYRILLKDDNQGR